MRKALLIGFEYKDKKKLPGIATDLYQVYSFLKSYHWNDNEIFVMTDIEKDDSTDVLKTSILDEIVNSGILSFIEDIKERKQYIQFKSHNHYNNFESLFSSVSNLFVYYTGHCKDNNIIFPNNSLVSLNIFKTYMDKSKNVLCIMDCCESGINLPFLLKGKTYKCHEEISKDSFVKSNMICLSSSLENEKSITSKSGSYFTRYLFEILNKYSELYIIREKITTSLSNIKQTINILSSYPKNFYIPGFLYSYPDISVEINRNYILIDLP